MKHIVVGQKNRVLSTHREYYLAVSAMAKQDAIATTIRALPSDDERRDAQSVCQDVLFRDDHTMRVVDLQNGQVYYDGPITKFMLEHVLSRAEEHARYAEFSLLD
ncbi:hypothetical protein KC887_02895 [Candidatus Kaiserbacteria bacterium]|nr:hypothetical protein [Candidatus Kaiserbacteria bacterium]